MNKLIVAVAGAGKTTHIVEKALEIENERVLITTYTIQNKEEIQKKMYEKNGYIPANIKIQTWFSFLLEHGVRPYQSMFIEQRINGIYFGSLEGAIFTPESKFNGHFLVSDKVYKDRIAKLVVKSNEDSDGAVLMRLSRIFKYIFLDEVQDMVGYDFELLKCIMSSGIKLEMVGDQRQKTYSTHTENKHKKYNNGNFVGFFKNECKDINIFIDENSLSESFRCCDDICSFSNKIYPDLCEAKSKAHYEIEHKGVFLVRKKDVDAYLEKYKPIQLRDSVKTKCNSSYSSKNFGESKGLTFERVIIYPTKPIESWLRNNSTDLRDASRSKLYVAVTRARYSVAFIFDFKDSDDIRGAKKYYP